MIRSKMTGLTLVAMGCLIACSLPATAQENNTYNQHATRFAISPPLRDLAKMQQPPVYGLHLANPVRRIPKTPTGHVVDPVEQSQATAPANFTLGANILGVGNGFRIGSWLPERLVERKSDESRRIAASPARG